MSVQRIEPRIYGRPAHNLLSLSSEQCVNVRIIWNV